MGNRYLVSGVQLGMLIGLPDKVDRQFLVDSIIDKQWVYTSDGTTDIEKDALDLLICREDMCRSQIQMGGK